jgi:outer membrane protein OmpA-like peptidoglycan-associated protein
MKIFSSLLALILLSTQAQADPVHLAHRFGIGLGGGVPIPIAHQIFKNAANTGWSVEGHADYYLTDAFGLEIEYQHLNFQNGSPLNNSYLAGINYRWFPTAAFTPVLGFNAGWGNTTSQIGLGPSESNFIGVGKAGFDIAMSNHLMLELSAKYNWQFSKINGNLDRESLIPGASLTWFLGGNEAMAEPAYVAPIMTPTPAAPVDGDDDGDGVPNSIDKCPNTPAGTKVNSLGCPMAEKVNQTIDIEFPSGKSRIPDSYDSEADKIVSLMKQHTDLKVEIQGYTDNVGSAAKNKTLSQARANSVRNYLAKNGVETSRVSAKGYGPESPIADNSTPEGRKQNRRVVASLQSMDSGN